MVYKLPKQGVAKIVGLLLGTSLIDSEKYGGRRPLFIAGSFAMGLSMVR